MDIKIQKTNAKGIKERELNTTKACPYTKVKNILLIKIKGNGNNRRLCIDIEIQKNYC